MNSVAGVKQFAISQALTKMFQEHYKAIREDLDVPELDAINAYMDRHMSSVIATELVKSLGSKTFGA
jgi:hypothetical protein